jgi:hypothetical protein
VIPDAASVSPAAPRRPGRGHGSGGRCAPATHPCNTRQWISFDGRFDRSIFTVLSHLAGRLMLWPRPPGVTCAVFRL